MIRSNLYIPFQTESNALMASDPTGICLNTRL